MIEGKINQTSIVLSLLNPPICGNSAAVKIIFKNNLKEIK